MAYTLGGIVGGIVGGFLIVTLISWLVSLAFKKDPPTPRAAKATTGAFLISSALAGLGFANGGPFAWWAAINYIVPALLAFAFLRWRFARNWVEDDLDEVSDLFK